MFQSALAGRWGEYSLVAWHKHSESAVILSVHDPDYHAETKPGGNWSLRISNLFRHGEMPKKQKELHGSIWGAQPGHILITTKTYQNIEKKMWWVFQTQSPFIEIRCYKKLSESYYVSLPTSTPKAARFWMCNPRVKHKLFIRKSLLSKTSTKEQAFVEICIWSLRSTGKARHFIKVRGC